MWRFRRDGRTAAVALVLLSGVGFRGPVRGQANSGVAPPRKGDTFAVNDDGRKIRMQHGELPSANFQIADVDLAGHEGVLDQAARILGRVSTKATGDASTALETACYRSADRGDSTILQFGRGEVQYSFELTSGGTTRNQRFPCLPSVKISRQLATASGLRLGETPDQAIAVLGLPTRRSSNATLGRMVLAYQFETMKKTAPRDLAEIRKQHPEMSEQEFVAGYSLYNLEESIHATFVRGILTDLAVDRLAVY
jgi:hypothetical protein